MVAVSMFEAQSYAGVLIVIASTAVCIVARSGFCEVQVDIIIPTEVAAPTGALGGLMIPNMPFWQWVGTVQ